MRWELSASKLSGSTDKADEKGGEHLGRTGDGGSVDVGLEESYGTPMMGRIWLRCSRRPIAFGFLGMFRTASKICGEGQM